MTMPYPDVIIFGEEPLNGRGWGPVYALHADPLGPLLQQLRMKPEAVCRGDRGGRAYLCVWRCFDSRLFLEQVLVRDTSGGRVLFEPDYFPAVAPQRQPSPVSQDFMPPDAELVLMRSWLAGKRSRSNGRSVLLPATWVQHPLAMVFACKGAELLVQEMNLEMPDPLSVAEARPDLPELKHFPTGGAVKYHDRPAGLRERVNDAWESLLYTVAEPARNFISQQVWRLLGE